MTVATLLVFFGSAALLIYTYAGFPLLVWLRSQLLRRPMICGDDKPSLSILIAAYNESECIARKLDHLLASDYPLNQLQVIVASDGSTDGTDQIVEAYPAPQVELIREARAGKAAALNSAAERARGEILVFTDANSIFAADALSHLVAPFADPEVGGVAGDQRYVQARAATASGWGERSYWNLDRRLKQWGSDAGNAISATGAIYAIRRQLFQGVPVGVTDDFAVSTSVIEQGFRLVFHGGAVAYEPVADSSRVEFGRKVRVMSRGFRAIWLRRRLLLPWRYGFYSVQLFSHKILRRLMFGPLMGLFLSSLLLWNNGWLYRGVGLAQLVFYAAALLPLFAGRRSKLLALPFFFCMVNTAAAIALGRALWGSRIATWEPHRGDSLPSTPS